MKFILILLIFVGIVFIAIGVYFYYQIRYRLYKDMVYICKFLKNDISFNKNDIDTILAKCSKNINYSTKYLINHSECNSKIVVNKNDYKNINEFFNSLGRGDVTFEINNINYYENVFEQLMNSSKEDLSKKGLTYFKLLIAVGLIVCVLLI